MIDNGQPFPSVNSLDSRVTANADGSYDLWLGPEQPDDVVDANWIRTNPGEGYMICLRFYGPTKPWYDQSWIPDDVVKIS
jgi:hypothetical protein